MKTRTKTSESDLKQPYPQRCSSSATAEPKLELLVSHIGENILFEFYADISFDQLCAVDVQTLMKDPKMKMEIRIATVYCEC